MLEHVPAPVGEALKGVRPGVEKTVIHSAALAQAPSTLKVESAAFSDGAALDRRFTEDGEGRSPALSWSDVPAGAVATVIVVEDADSPTPAPLVHLLAWRAGGDGGAPEGTWGPDAADGAVGLNSFHKLGWLPPDPPPGHGAHRYVVQVYAVDAWPEFDGAPGKAEVVKALEGHVLAMGSTIGTYERT